MACVKYLEQCVARNKHSISNTYYACFSDFSFSYLVLILRWANSFSSIWVGDHYHCHAHFESFVFWNMQSVPREIAQTYSKDAFKNDLFSCISKSETSVQLCTYLNRPSWMVRGNWASVSLSQAPCVLGCLGSPDLHLSSWQNY